MKLQIVAGPTFVEVAEGIVSLTEKHRPVFTFKVEAQVDVPSIVIRAKKILLKQNHPKPRFQIVGKSEEGDQCRVSYRPLSKNKGLVHLTD